MKIGLRWWATGMVMACTCVAASVNAANTLNIVPTPKSVKALGGEMPITAESRIVYADASLKPLAEIFSREILAITTIKLQPVAADASTEPKAGDIVLRINSKLRADNEIIAVQNREVVKTKDFAHTINVTDKCVVEGWDYRSVCEGTATLLQALTYKNGKAALPKMEIKDWPFADYTGFMLDVARQDVPIVALKSFVVSCRFWKIRYLHLHLSDSSMMFPFRKFPQAGKYNGAISNGDICKVWDRDELIKLVAFAEARGVALVPELESPGHCGGYQEAVNPALGDPRLRMMDIANDNTYVTLEEMVNDMCDVFTNTPYFHIGGDEVQTEMFRDAPHVAKYLKDHNMPDVEHGGVEALMKRHVKLMNEFVKKRGKKTLYWGSSCSGMPQDPELKDCIVYAWYTGAQDALDKGMTIITVPWEIKGPWEKWNIFNNNNEMLKRTDSVLGGLRVAWEQSAESYVNGCVYESAVRQEGTWAVDSTATADGNELKAREKVCIERMRKIAAPVQIKADGVITNASGGYQGYEYQDSLKVTLEADVPAGCTIHFTTDASEPTTKSALYTGPTNVTGDLRLRAAMFDKDGELVGGYTFAPKYYWKSFEKNLTTGKPVESSGGKNPDEMPNLAADGWVHLAHYWGTIPAPQWWQVDLEKEYELGAVRIFPYWDGARYYQYTVSVGTDTNHLKQVVDASHNTKPETDQGRTYTFPPTKARYIRVNMLKNSDNDAVHLVEVRAYEAAKTVELAPPVSGPNK